VRVERTATKKLVRTDALPDSAWCCAGYDAVVCIDVLLSATTIVTALSQGRRVSSLTGARALADVAPRRRAGVTEQPMRGMTIGFGGPDLQPGGRLLLSFPLAEMLAAALLQPSVWPPAIWSDRPNDRRAPLARGGPRRRRGW
jgi:hypothetical protein